MNILRHIVGITCELLTIKDPYDAQEWASRPRVESKVTGSYDKQNHYLGSGKPAPGTHKVWRIQANSWHEAEKYVKGKTLEGNRTWQLNHVGGNQWELDVAEWDDLGLLGEEDAEPQSSALASFASCLMMIFVPILLAGFVYLFIWAQYHPDLVLP